jgi:hypothetical protein
MKLLLTDWISDWRAKQPQSLEPQILDLELKHHLEFLILALGNAHWDEACFETDSLQALQTLHGALRGIGGATPLPLNDKARARPLFRPGYDLFTQDGISHFFVNPTPRPDLFLTDTFDAYIKEFTTP